MRNFFIAWAVILTLSCVVTMDKLYSKELTGSESSLTGTTGELRHDAPLFSEPPPPATPSFENFHLPPGLDANGDGDVTRAEHRAFFDRQFADMDANGDRKITRKEFIDGIQRQFKRETQPPAPAGR